MSGVHRFTRRSGCCEADGGGAEEGVDGALLVGGEGGVDLSEFVTKVVIYGVDGLVAVVGEGDEAFAAVRRVWLSLGVGCLFESVDEFGC